MVTFPIGWTRKAILIALLGMSTSTGAQQPPCLTELARPRTFYLSKDATSEPPEIFVTAGVVTTLRFNTPCDPSRTKLLGWEGRFEPLLVGGRSVVIVPLRNLAPDDRFLLLVTLADGTELPFTLTASKTFVDRQVSIFPNPESSEALRSALEEKNKENHTLWEENRRREKEETSVDHALAALLANGQLSMTPFQERSKWTTKDEGFKADVLLLEDGRGRTAVILQVTNLDPKRPWRLEEARLSTLTTSEPRPFALRMTPTTLLSGQTGRIAIVTADASFNTEVGLDKLLLELFRDGGLRQGYVVLERRAKR